MRLLQRPLRLPAMPLGFEAGNGSKTVQVRAVCNLYSITTNQAAIIALFRVLNRYVGNLPPMPGVFPDYPAPVIRNTGAERELTMMRWGMPPPPKFGGPPVTNNPALCPNSAVHSPRNAGLNAGTTGRGMFEGMRSLESRPRSI